MVSVVQTVNDLLQIICTYDKTLYTRWGYWDILLCILIICGAIASITNFLYNVRVRFLKRNFPPNTWRSYGFHNWSVDDRQI